MEMKIMETPTTATEVKDNEAAPAKKAARKTAKKAARKADKVKAKASGKAPAKGAKKAKRAPKDPTMSKAAFVRSLPADMPAKEVVAKAEKAGISLDEKGVHGARSNDREKAKAGAKKARKVAKVADAKAVDSKGVNKADFIRSLPTDMPAKEVVAKAEKAGISLTEAYVYAIRTAAKAKAAKAGKKTARRGRVAGAPTKADFIRGLSADIPAKEVVALAAKAGISLTESHVYTVRSSGKARGRGGRPAKAPVASLVTPSLGITIDAALFKTLVKSVKTLGDGGSAALRQAAEFLDAAKEA